MKKTETQHAVIDRTESFVQSLFANLVTFVSLCFCIWLSMGSRWWTLVTGIMFLLFGFGKIATALKLRKNEFKTKEELIKWADGLDWPKDL